MTHSQVMSSYDRLIEREQIGNIVGFLYRSRQDEKCGKITTTFLKMMVTKEKADALQAEKDKRRGKILKLFKLKDSIVKDATQADTKLREVLSILLDAPATLDGENDDLINEILVHLE